jgi:DNA-binding transcriptional LysR family regulator
MSMANASVDPNLLIALDVLLAERSVTRAAQRLGVTQSAVSHKLRTLREQLGDPLLVASRHGLVPTDRALAIAAPLRQALLDLNASAARGAAFDPARAERAFTLSTVDYGELVAVPWIVARLGGAAPGIELRIEPPQRDFVERMADGRLDAAVAPPLPVPGTIMRTLLASEGFAVVLRRGHPYARRRWSLARYLELSHLLIAPRGAPGSIVDDLLAERGLRRRVAVRVSSFVAAPHVVAASDLCLTAPTRLIDALAARLELVVRPVPLEIPPADTVLYWHARVDRDQAHRWFRDQVVAAVSGRRSRVGVAAARDHDGAR